MKRIVVANIILLFMRLVFCCELIHAEVEPNNTPDQANTLAPNGSDTGHLDISSDTQDWWKITITSEGALIVATLSDASLEIDNYLYDSDKTTQLAHYLHGGSQPEDTTEYMNLLPGTYYVKTYCYSGQGSYTITSKFIPAQYQNDTEPNDSAAVATTFPVNTSGTGHLGFYGNGYTDQVDWRKVTIPGDGELIISTYSDPTIEIDNYIYDPNNLTELAGYLHGGSHPEDTSEFVNLVAGTYYIRTLDYGGYGSYTIKNQFIPANLPNDTEPNDSAGAAIPLVLNGNSTGHLGFQNGSYRDNEDWRKVTTTQDGQFIIATYSDVTLEIDNYIYDQDKTTQLAGYLHGGSQPEDTSEVLNLGPGTYYVRSFAYSGYGSYTIKHIFIPAPLTNDIEPNDTITQAVALPLNTVKSGHLGYQKATVVDRLDYYSFTLSQPADTLFVRVDNTVGLDVDLNLYDSNGQYITQASRSGIWELLIAPQLAAGTYYVEAKAYTGFGSYYIIASTTRPGEHLVDVKTTRTQIPTEWSLLQNYPNPFNPSTTIRYSLPYQSRVTLTIYNILGQVVSELVNGTQEAGWREVRWNAKAASGMYIYRLTAVSTSDPNKRFVQTKKMMLVR